jgi:hypothetical protein
MARMRNLVLYLSKINSWRLCLRWHPFSKIRQIVMAVTESLRRTIDDFTQLNRPTRLADGGNDHVHCQLHGGLPENVSRPPPPRPNDVRLV